MVISSLLPLWTTLCCTMSMSQEVLLWLNAQYSTVAQYCSTVQTLFTQTQEEDALIDTNKEASS